MEALKGLVERYRYADKKYHIIIPLLVGLVFGYYWYSNTIPDEYTALETSEKAAGNAREMLQKQKANALKVKTLKEDKIKADQMLIELSKRLPNNVDIDSILANIAAVAKDANVTIQNLEPNAEANKANQPARDPKAPAAAPDSPEGYVQNTLRISMVGKFSETMRFFERMLHEDKVVAIDNIRINSQKNGSTSTTADAKSDRDNVVLVTTFNIVTFKSTKKA